MLLQKYNDHASQITRNSFSKCKADIGGALFWNFKMPRLSQNQYHLNVGTLYGFDLASYPQRLGFISEQEGLEILEGKNVKQISSQKHISLSPRKSGENFNTLYLALLDSQNQVVTNIQGGAVFYTVSTQMSGEG